MIWYIFDVVQSFPMTMLCQEQSTRTRTALLWMNLAAEPLLSMYFLLPFILCREWHASAKQVALFLTLRPVLCFCAFWLSSWMRKTQLVAHLILFSLLAYIPFLFFPFVPRYGVLLICAACYQLFSRASLPALIEVLRRNMDKAPREKSFSWFYFISFTESGLLGCLFGWVLEGSFFRWDMLLLIAALIGMTVYYPLRRIAPIPSHAPEGSWMESIRLLKRKEVAIFQWLFMAGGAAFMFMAPALSRFYAHDLVLSYKDMAMGRFVMMALGVSLASHFWQKGLHKLHVLPLTRLVLLGFSLFPCLILIARWNHLFLFLGFFIYGIAQAGSHLIWNLSGTLFDPEKDSMPHTRLNLLMVGLRGLIFPFLGGVICDRYGPIVVLWLGMALCGLGALSFWRTRIERVVGTPS